MYNAPKFWRDVNKRVRYYNWYEVLGVLKEEGIEVKKEAIKLGDYYCPLELKYKDVFKDTPYEYNSYNVLIRMNWDRAGTWHAHIPDQRAVVTVHFFHTKQMPTSSKHNLLVHARRHTVFLIMIYHMIPVITLKQ